MTEISAAIELERFRRETGVLEDISFPTISAAGPHAAMPHYRVSETSNAKWGEVSFSSTAAANIVTAPPTSLGQFVSALRAAEMRDRFTRVLKGHIAVARATFPVGTTGAQLDSFARRALWAAGLDFDHGTGHGVGVYLSVHEGPQRIAKTGAVPLEPGMIVSNEPGYYAVGRFGIRIENLVVVEPRRIAGGRARDARLQNAFVGADRHARGRSATSRACGKRMAQRLSQPRAPGAFAFARSLDAGLAGKSDAQNLNLKINMQNCA